MEKKAHPQALAGSSSLSPYPLHSPPSSLPHLAHLDSPPFAGLNGGVGPAAWCRLPGNAPVVFGHGKPRLLSIERKGKDKRKKDGESENIIMEQAVARRPLFLPPPPFLPPYFPPSFPSFLPSLFLSFFPPSPPSLHYLPPSPACSVPA